MHEKREGSLLGVYGSERQRSRWWISAKLLKEILFRVQSLYESTRVSVYPMCGASVSRKKKLQLV